MQYRAQVLGFLIAVTITYSLVVSQGHRVQKTELSSQVTSDSIIRANDYYLSKIQPIFDARCIACHACYNSPCQMNLTSYSGVVRGATKRDIYDFGLIRAKPPTRLDIDGTTSKEWKDLNFFSVLSDDESSRGRETFGVDKAESTLGTLIGMTQRDFNQDKGLLDSGSSRMCPNRTIIRKESGNELPISELEVFQSQYRNRGMPFGFPPLEQNEIRLIDDWLKAGAKGPDPAIVAELASPGEFKNIISEFENFLNDSSFKSMLTARYIYEHLFLADIYFSKNSPVFFRLVRAENVEGQPKEIPTVRPYDSPGKPFHYRLQKILGTVVHKNHIPYYVDSIKIGKWKEQFLDSNWHDSTESWPAYGQLGANPFVTFRAIPASARSQFLLDDAYYHVMSFIKGPVCNGNTAVNVIDDNFWVFFVDPKADVSVTDPRYLLEHGVQLANPEARPPGQHGLTEIRKSYAIANEAKYKLYQEKFPQGLGLQFIWDGDGHNPNALLTVYRHQDSAAVLRGAHGQVPKTLWILDYPLFEDLYYNLVAGYNIFDKAKHHIYTRRYMNHSRVDAQDLFINLLPKVARLDIRKQWSGEVPGQLSLIEKFLIGDQDEKMDDKMPNLGLGLPTAISFKGMVKDPKGFLVGEIFSKRLSPAVQGVPDRINRVSDSSGNEVENIFSKIAGKPMANLSHFPDVAYVRVRQPDGNMEIYNIIHNKEHFNVSFFFFEDKRRNPTADSLNFIKAYGASYPNIYFDIQANEAAEFVGLIEALSSDRTTWKRLVKRFGVLRSNPKFWIFSDWVTSNFRRLDPIEGAPLDLSRYGQDY